MVHMEQTRLIYSADPANENRPHYIDLFRGLCLQNMKNMTQFKKGSPLLIAGTIRLAVDGENVEAISPVWPVFTGCIYSSLNGYGFPVCSCGGPVGSL